MRKNGIKIEKVSLLNSEKVVLRMPDGSNIIIGMKDYDLLNRTGAINEIVKGNGYWMIRHCGKTYSFQRFLKLKNIQNGKDKIVMHKKGVNYNTDEDVEVVSKEEYMIKKVIKGIDRNKKGRNKTGINYTYFNEVENKWQIRIARYNGKMRTKRTSDAGEIYNIIREIQLKNIQEAIQNGDMRYVKDRAKRWNLK